jgi:phenylacetyl-CoA:acceptor oxidoreductase subunit 2
VWLEIGRPLRALHVFFNPRMSWMTREAMVAALLFPLGLAALFVPELKWIVLVLALAFVYCQSRILQAAKGIPAWREPLLVPLVVLTGLAEGAGLFMLVQPNRALAVPALLALAGALVIARHGVWLAYRRRVDRVAAPRAIAALDDAGRVLLTLGLWPALAVVLPFIGEPLAGAAVALVAAAGLLAAFAGASLKYTLVTRAGFNQGFALAHLPVRGVPRQQET